MLSLLSTLALAGAPSLDIGGACPGLAEISASGFTPGGTVGVMTGRGVGGDPMIAGPCSGDSTSLSSLSFITTVRADALGNIAVRPELGDGVCGSYAQFLDASTCALSNVAYVGGEDDCINFGWHLGPRSPEDWGWLCPAGYRLPRADEFTRVESCLSPDDLAYIDYYHNVAIEVGGCNCKWSAAWCTYESVETFDGRMCGDFDQLHVCLAE
jgi:hypothetical protein